MKQTYYITTTLPYVNADPHIGFSLEIIAADVLARFHAHHLNEQVLFNTGTDEHGQKIHQKAVEAGISTQEYVDASAAAFIQLKELLSIEYTHFIRTTNPAHKKAAQSFWERCEAQGDIYKKMYTLSYCVGCELEKQSSELVDGRCPLHPTTEIEVREEENYFFSFSNYQQTLLDYYAANPTFVEPESKMKEIVSFVSGGLKDFSISRLKTKMPWGVPVPNDPDHVMYVWFDALVNYISTLGWPTDQETFSAYWPGVQVAGKDNLRQQAAMWQAMLASAGLPLSKKILINGFITVDGNKMSKSLGNVISPQALVSRYGTEATRYLLLQLGPFNTDMDVTWEKLDTAYTAALSNGIGNTCSRIAKMCEKNGGSFSPVKQALPPEYLSLLENNAVSEALSYVITTGAAIDQFLSTTQPWKKTGEEQTAVLTEALHQVLLLAELLLPFMPETAKTIAAHFSGKQITALAPLFPRLPQ